MPPPKSQTRPTADLPLRVGRVARTGLAALGGAVLALTLPPLDLLPGLIGYAALLVALLAADRDRRRPLERLWLGAVFGFAFHLAGLWWVGMAFLVDQDTHGWLLPLGVIGLPLLLAPFHAVAGYLAGLAAPRIVPRMFALAAAIMLTEALRGVLFTGFPWNVPAAQLGASLTLAQGVAVVGLEAMALPAVLLGTAPLLIVAARGWARLATAGFVVALAGLFALFGAVRLSAPPMMDGDGAVVRIVQPNIAQADKWVADQRPRIWTTLLTLTATPAERPPALVVWPETAIPFLYRTPSLEQSELAFALPGDAVLMTGAVELIGPDRRAANRVYMLDEHATPTAYYDKVRLVPFGEFVPFGDLLARVGFQQIVGGAGQFVGGEGPRALDTPLGPMQPLICYEVIFHDMGVTPDTPLRALVNLTNDAWFGQTPGPYQHLRLAQLRAIGAGLPVLRAANTGVSAVIDPQGRIRDSLALGTSGVIDTAIPAATVPILRRGGWLLGWALFGAFVGLAGFSLWREKSRFN